MVQLADVQRFVSAANGIAVVDELADLLAEVVAMLGFDYYALLHHVPRAQARPDAIRIVAYPETWQEIIAAKGYFAHDPVLAASEKSVATFDWSSVPNIIEMTPRQMEMMEAARGAGISDGFVIPVHLPGEYAGSCCFAVRPGRELPVACFPAAQYIGCFAFEAARRVMQRVAKSRPKDEPLSSQSLTQRQFDCLVLAAQGKSDWDIGRLLGISDQTVHKHIEESKRRYCVPTRMQLVVRALFNGHLTFADVLN